MKWTGTGGTSLVPVKSDERTLGRQHQGMDRPGVFQVPEGNGE